MIILRTADSFREKQALFYVYYKMFGMVTLLRSFFNEISTVLFLYLSRKRNILLAREQAFLTFRVTLTCGTLVPTSMQHNIYLKRLLKNFQIVCLFFLSTVESTRLARTISVQRTASCSSMKRSYNTNNITIMTLK